MGISEPERAEFGPSRAYRPQGRPKLAQRHGDGRGRLARSPIDLRLPWNRTHWRSGWRWTARAWKSMQAAGTLTLPPALSIPQGTVHLRIGALRRPLSSRCSAASWQAASTPRCSSSARFGGTDLDHPGRPAMPGTAAVSRAALDATVTNLRKNPTVQATLALDGISAGSLGAPPKSRCTGHKTHCRSLCRPRRPTCPAGRRG